MCGEGEYVPVCGEGAYVPVRGVPVSGEGVYQCVVRGRMHWCVVS